MKKMEEKNMYLQLHEAMDALLHICKDGCRTIGPRDKVLKGSQINCGFPACKGLEMLVRHFSICKIRVPGGCGRCKRMWQLLVLHSRMCHEPNSCKVPLCRHFMEKMQNQSKKDNTKWKLLVNRVMAAKNASRPSSVDRSHHSQLLGWVFNILREIFQLLLQLLDRVFNILSENNPELARDRHRTVRRKKTVFVNLTDLCKTMHRQPEHVMNFLLAEMGSLDAQQRLVVKVVEGRFAPKNYEGILLRYVYEYVICDGCRSRDTILSKENRPFIIRCEQCGCERSVAPIKAGFQVRVGLIGRRKAGPERLAVFTDADFDV